MKFPHLVERWLDKQLDRINAAHKAKEISGKEWADKVHAAFDEAERRARG